MEKGNFYWVTGLSGAGKTTVGTLLYQYLKQKKDNVVLLDGDDLRYVMGNTDFTEEGRAQTNERNARLYQLLTNQGIDVICCAIGMREAYRVRNREMITNYKEIYLKVSMDELLRRDPKGLYRRALNHETDHVYGIDIPFEEPANPSVLIENEGSMTPEEALRQIVAALDL